MHLFAALKNHPFAVEAFFESSLVLTYAAPKEDLQSFLPPSLELDTFNNQWGFIAVAIVKTKGLRPKGAPAFLGNDFILTGYRLFVRYHTSKGKRLRGLYILKSETDSRKMEVFGNIFTHYNYTTTDISLLTAGNTITVRSQNSDLNIAVEKPSDEAVNLPPASPFADWKDARRFAGPLPFTFTFNEAKKEMLIIEGVREDWQPQPLTVINHKVGFVENLRLKSAVLANAFLVRNIPYYWKKGRIDPWQPQAESHSKA